jgi:small conductance mechanosensitive channel
MTFIDKPMIIKISISILIFLVFYIIASSYKNYNDKNKSNSKHNLLNYEFYSILYYIILSIGIIISLLYLNIQSSTLFAVIGSIGLAISLSLQSLLTNVNAGFYIGFNNLYKIDDIIELNGNGTNYKGKVIDFSIFNTTIMIDTNPIIIPNTLIQNSILTVYKS